MSYGMLSHVHFNFQNSFGTSQVDSLEAAPVSGVTLALGIEQLVENNMYNRTGESPYHEGMNVVEGDISMEAHPYGMGWLLKSVFGQVVTVSGTDLHTHTFVPRAADFDARAAMHPLTVKADYDAGSSAIFHSLVGNNLSMEIANGELLNLTASYIGAGFSRSAETAPTYQDSDPFQWNQASASYNGVGEVDFKSLSIQVNNNLSAKHLIDGSKFPHRIRRDAPYQVTVNGTMTFESHSYWQAFEAQDEVALAVTFTGLTPDVFTIEIPKLRLGNFAPQISGQGENEVSFDGVGVYDTASSAAIICTLVNCQPFY